MFVFWACHPLPLPIFYSRRDEMSMFCFQCQEAANGEGCKTGGVCGKSSVTAELQDCLVHVARSVALFMNRLSNQSMSNEVLFNECSSWIRIALFTTITNANFDNLVIEARVLEGLGLRHALKSLYLSLEDELEDDLSLCCLWTPASCEQMCSPPHPIGVLRTSDPDTRSLKELLTYGLKGFAAYLHHAAELGVEEPILNAFLVRGLAATFDNSHDSSALKELVFEAGAKGVEAMALLDTANTSRYGHPEVSQVRIDVGKRPGILVSGHDLSDLETLLEQSKDAGIDVYTHSEMLPAHSYPRLKKYLHLYGNYGNAWWNQHQEFTSFHGPILFTTNCIVPPPSNATYLDKVFTTGVAGFPGYRHIESYANGFKDFSELISLAKSCQSPDALEQGSITTGFGHEQVAKLSKSILKAINSGEVKRFVVMAGCDGRHPQRSYYTDFAKQLDDDAVILTAGCAKYRYNKLGLEPIVCSSGDVIPRVLDAGQCNDSYSIALTALSFQKAFGLDDINDLPIEYNIAWYEQKAVIVLLALLHLGVKNIQLGPTLPAFFSPGVTRLLIEQFGIKQIQSTAEITKCQVY